MRDYEARPLILDCSRLKSDTVLKGYKGMCEALGVKEVKKGKGRMLQEEDWRRYFEWEEMGNGYLRKITYIKEFPDIIPPPPRAVYTALIEMMVVYKLSQEPKLEIEKTWNQLFEYLGMVNDKFADFRTYKAYKHIDENIRHIRKLSYADFGQRTRSGFKRKLRTALNSMQKRQLVVWDEILYCVYEIEEIGIKGNGKKEKREIHSIAGKQERAIKTEIYRYVLKEEFGLDNEDQIIAQGKYYDYIDSVNKCLYERYKIKRFYNRVRISYDYRTMGNAIEDTRRNLIKIASEFDFDVKLNELTDLLIDMLNSEANSKHENAKRKLEGFPKDEDGERKYYLPENLGKYELYENDDYILEQELFSKFFICRYVTDRELIEEYGENIEE